MVLVKSVKPIAFGWLLVTFDNKTQKIVDIRPYMTRVLEKLKDPDFLVRYLLTLSWKQLLGPVN